MQGVLSCGIASGLPFGEATRPVDASRRIRDTDAVTGPSGGLSFERRLGSCGGPDRSGKKALTFVCEATRPDNETRALNVEKRRHR